MVSIETESKHFTFDEVEISCVKLTMKNYKSEVLDRCSLSGTLLKKSLLDLYLLCRYFARFQISFSRLQSFFVYFGIIFLWNCDL